MTGPNVDKIPTELRARPQWLAWRYEVRVEGKPPTKVPYCALEPTRRASSTDPATWAPFGAAFRAHASHGFDGIGYAFAPDDGISGVDLDRCRDPQTGTLAPWARRIIDRLRSYTEVSPSGTGVKIFLRAKLPGTGKRRDLDDGHVELYSAGRYFTTTGAHVPGTPTTLTDAQPALDALLAELFPPQPEPPPRPESTTGADPDDDALLERIRASRVGPAFEKLWSGDWSDHGSQSEADLALASHLTWWSGGDTARADRLFRRSGLYRAKWDRDGYRTATLARAAQQSTYYDPHRHTHSNGHAEDPEPDPEPGTADADVDAVAAAERLTDLGNARRFVARHGPDVRHAASRGGFYVWDGSRFRRDTTGEAHRRAKRTARDIWGEVAQGANNDDRQKLAQHAHRTESARSIQHMLTLVATEPEIAVDADDFDKNGYLLNVQNGTVDLRTGELRPHDRGDLLTRLAPVVYDPAATAPLWHSFLHLIFAVQDDLIDYIARAAGYSLTADVSEQVLFFGYGPGGNGKSTFLTALSAVMGEYATAAPPDLLVTPKGADPHPTSIAKLCGARFVPAIEVEEGRRMAESRVKWLTGADVLTARLMRADFFDFVPTHKLWLGANHKPVITGTDPAVWRRIHLVPFAVSIADVVARDAHFPDKLRAEYPGILAWAVRGCLDWQRRGLDPPDAVRTATAAYRRDSDTIGDFLEECCVLEPEATATVASIYAAYVAWAERSGEKSLTKKAFSQRLAERGLPGRRGAGGARFYDGVRLRTTDGGAE